MDIPNIRLNPLPLIGNTTTEARARLAWQTGEIIAATVVVSRAGELTLEMGGTRVQAQSTLQFTPGQHLRLQVIDSKELPILRVLTDTVANHDNNLLIQGRALRLALPQQGPLAPVFMDLERLVQASIAKTNRSLRSPLASLAASILARLPQINDLANPDGLKQAMQESGLFLEAHLANLPQEMAPPADLKADLLRLASIATDSSRSDDQEELDITLQSAVQGAVARLEVNQLTWLDGARLNLELPIRRADGTDILTLILEQGEEEPDGRGGAQRPWTATLRFNFDGLGALVARVAVTNEVAVFFQTEHGATSRLLENRLDELRTALMRVGLTPGRLSAQTGVMPQLSRPASVIPSMPLLDVRA